MTHSFLLQPAKWSLQGQYTEREQQPLAIEGTISVAWRRQSWFKLETRLVIPESATEIISQCKGHLDSSGKLYTYVLQHSILGSIEGEGYLGVDSIVQHYWVVGSTQRRLGFDTFYYLSESEYSLTSVILESHNLRNTVEAKLKQII